MRASALAVLFTATGRSADEAPVLITSPGQMWELSTEAKAIEHPLLMEGRVSYYDPMWKLFWLEQNGIGTYMQLSEHAPAIRTGQRVRIEGTIMPYQGLDADRVKVTVLREEEPITPVEISGRSNELETFNCRIVMTSAYVDSQQYTDADHVRLALIVDERPVIGWVKPDDPQHVPNWEGKFIRVQALYGARFDPTKTQATVELWIGAQRNVSVEGSRDNFAGFALPSTPIARIHQLPVGTPVLVRGQVEGHEAGSAMIVRDATGEIDVRTLEHRRVPLGTEIEATGRVGNEGQKWVINAAMHRKMNASDSNTPMAAADEMLTRVSQIRELSLEQAGRAQPVRISGLVTWSLPDLDFFFLQDVSGGIRVRFDLHGMPAPALGKYLEIEGVTADGGYVPGVTLKHVKDLGAMSPPPAKMLTFDRAIAGKEDGQWVEMRGFLQRTESDGDWRRVHVTTPSGEFIGLLKSPVNVTANPGSLVSVRGVCEAIADSTGRMTGVMLRVPFLHSITTDDDAPIDYYDLPLRSIRSLRQLSGAREMTRVRVIGTVLHAARGRSLNLQEGDATLLVLTRQPDAPAPGTKVEVVGILGWEGARLVLRESVYLQIGTEPRPVPLTLADPSHLASALDGRLVKTRGVVIDSAPQQGYVRFTLQAGKTLFEATLDTPDDSTNHDFAAGTGLELTGIYGLVFDDTREVRSFTLQLRSPADVRVYARPKLWTVPRALMACSILGGVTLLGIGWITALRRRVGRQTQQIREQLERQSRLETEVQRAARLESLGELAGGIAHDFNNLLTIIIGNAGLALMDGKVSATAANCLREIERGAERARNLTRQLLTFAKGGEPVRTSVDLAQVVRQSTDLALHDSNVRCDYTIDRDLSPAHADKNQIAQAVHNIVRNAVQAMPHGGVLMVTLKNETLAENSKAGLAGGDYVKLSFSDSGEGIKPEVLPRIFDPYFSARKSGSGLGLATVYSIIKRHHGRVEAESSPGAGATFHLWLPVAKIAPEAVAAPAPRKAPPDRGTLKAPRVLLMDDELSIREVAGAVLRQIGTDPVTVADGAAALREFSLAQYTGRPFELVILDLTIPGGMGGREAMELIRKLDADVPAIVSSGYSSDPVMANYARHGFQAVVAKPYEVNALAAVVHELLGRAP